MPYLYINAGGGKIYNKNTSAVNEVSIKFDSSWGGIPFDIYATDAVDPYNRLETYGVTLESTGYYTFICPAGTFSPGRPWRTGYTFTGWEFDYILFGASTSEFPDSAPGYAGIGEYSSTGVYVWARLAPILSGSYQLTAQWEANNYQITFVDQNGNTLKTITKAYHSLFKSSDFPDDPTPPAGYVFDGWAYDDGAIAGTGITVGSMVDSEGMTIYPKFTLGQYSLTINPDGGTYVYNSSGSTTTSSKSFTFYGDQAYVPICTSAYYDLTPNGVTAEKNSTASSLFFANRNVFVPGLPYKNGYRFSKWKITSPASGGEISSPSGFYSYDADNSSAELWAYAISNPYKNITVQAQWSEYKLEVDKTTTLYIEPRGVTVYAKFTPTSNGTYIFTSSNSQGGIDPQAWLCDSSFAEISGTYNDDLATGNTNFKITYALSKDTTYYLAVRDYATDGNQASSVQVTVTKLPRYTLTLNQVTSTEITSLGQIVECEFTPPATGTYIFESIASSGIDPEGSLYSPSGDSLHSDTDSSDNDSNFFIKYQLTRGNTYLLTYYDYGNNNTGQVGITVTQYQTIGTGEAEHSGGAVQDRRYFYFTPLASGTYRFKSKDYNRLTPSIKIVDNNGSILTNQTASTNGNFDFTLNLTKGITYTITTLCTSGTSWFIFPFTITQVLNDADTIDSLGSGSQWFEFTPSTTAYYKFYPEGSSIWTSGMLTNKAGYYEEDNLIDDFYDYPLECEFVAGTTYYIQISTSTSLKLHLNMLGVIEIYDSTTSSWKRAIPYIYNGSTWKQAMGYTYKNSTDKWQPGI